jgi:hypothetical protein
MSSVPTSPALRPIVDLETVLKEMLDEHRKLLTLLEGQQEAMQALNVAAMESFRTRQEVSRSRILRLEDRRRGMVQQIARINQIKGEPKIPAIAELYPQRKPQLLALRGELQIAMRAVADRSYIVTRLGSAVLGHLNTAMRILSSAVGNGGMYTNRGVPKVSRRIGVMEAVG